MKIICNNYEVEYSSFIFPAGEPHIRIKEPLMLSGNRVSVSLDLYSPNDLANLLLACSAIKKSNGVLDELYIGYFISSRQDRVANAGEPLSLKVYTEIINSLNFKKVVVVDPHSDVLPALLNNCNVDDNYDFFMKCIISNVSKDYYLISPDQGASKKTQSLAKKLNNEKIAFGSKVRNTMTGKITSFDVDVDDFKGKDCVVVDDICDGGGTFIGLAEKLKERNAGRLFLFVSHGLFTKGEDLLNDYYYHIQAWRKNERLRIKLT